ncbi:MAG: hypothetical protein FJ009_15920 [Chloroflexi bacterium]|nr:hypothetical protein [Chloroflexota bacterium]
MIRTLSLTTDVPPDRKVQIVLPDDVPAGVAEIIVMVTPRASKIQHTLGDLARSEFFGMWRDRTDIGDSVEFARRLRAEAWSRAV